MNKDLTSADIGARVTFPSITGSITYADELGVTIAGDDGIEYGIAIAGGTGKVVLKRANPKNWPPQPGDVWKSGKASWASEWKIEYVKIGSRQAFRLVSRHPTGTDILSYGQWLKTYPDGVLQSRRSK